MTGKYLENNQLSFFNLKFYLSAEAANTNKNMNPHHLW